MNNKLLQKHFSRIGAKFAVKTHEDVTHYARYSSWRNRVHEPELRTSGRECVLVYESTFREHLEVEVMCAPRTESVLILSLSWFNSRRIYLCRMVAERVEAVALPDEKSKPIAAYLNEIERKEARLNENKQSRNKRQRKIMALSYAVANKRVPLDGTQYDAYTRLVAACRNTKFLREEDPVIAAYGNTTHNTYATALLRVAKFYRDWRYEPETWRPSSHNASKSFHALLEHLFVRYPIPSFLESVWFREKENWIRCYIEVARGVNIRQVNALEFPLTKKMAHHTMQAPDRFTMEEAIRWGQVHGLGGNARFYSNIVETRIPDTSKRNPAGHAFWQSVLEWLLMHPMLAPGQYGPLIDFIRREKHRDANYKVAGRSPQVMIRAMEAWHRDLNRQRNGKVPPSWSGHHLDWWYAQKDREGAITDWRILEITTSERLRMEGMTMKHCVYSYGWSCAKGSLAIFSLQANGKPVLTVEYVPGTRRIGEVRGACNRVPTAAEWAILHRWAMAHQLG